MQNAAFIGKFSVQMLKARNGWASKSEINYFWDSLIIMQMSPFW